MANVLRKQQRITYTVIENELLNDSRLSFRARGIAAYLLSKPDGWIIRQAHIVRQGPEGRDAIRNAMKELRDHGYAEFTKVQDEKGRWHTETRVADYPHFHTEKGVDNRTLENRTSVSPSLGEPAPIVKTEVANTEIVNTDNNSFSDSVESAQQEPVHQVKTSKTKFPREIRNPMMEMLAEICAMNMKVKGVAPQLGKTTSALLEADYTTDDLKRWFHEVWVNDWRGQKGQRPRPHEVLADIGKLDSIPMPTPATTPVYGTAKTTESVKNVFGELIERAKERENNEQRTNSRRIGTDATPVVEVMGSLS